ncbi:hypothetical protein BLSTO_01350 [Blastocystis sp. subtype 1]
MDFSGELWSVCSLQLDYSFTNNVLTTEWDDVDSLVPSAKESTPAPATNRRQSPLIPISLCHLLKCDVDETGRVSIYNNTTAVVCIVGRLYAAETKANCTYYSIHDGTGSITARHWSFDSDSKSSSLVNHYVKVLGVAKKYKTDISINVQHIAPVSSFNTITLHWLAVLQVARSLAASQPLAVNRQPVRASAPLQNTIDRYMKPTPAPSVEDAFASGLGDAPLSETQKKVLRVIQEFGLRSTEGVSMATILQNARMLHLSDADVVSSVHQLLSNGNAYNTVDSSHFKPTNLC